MMSRRQIENTIIVVNEEPYCVWELDLRERNKEFLEGIDANYFSFLVEEFLAAEDEKRAAIALRITFHHALETMFSFMGALIQAPECVYAWIAKCSTQNLRQIVERISNSDEELYSKWNIKPVTWDRVSEIIFQAYLPGTEKNKRTRKLYAELWQALASNYCDQTHVDEYNSLKHGLRIRPGGFGLRIGKEHQYGVPPPEEEMRVIGHSDHGTTYFKLEQIGEIKGNRSLRSRRVSLNWRIERVVLLTRLVSMSIGNVVSALRIANGVKANTVKFHRPVEDSDFEKPWTFTPGVISCGVDYLIEENWGSPTTRKELLNVLANKKKS